MTISPVQGIQNPAYDWNPESIRPSFLLDSKVQIEFKIEWGHSRPQGFSPFSKGSPGDEVGPESLKKSPTANLSFRQIQSFCQLLSLCTYYILLLFKHRFQSAHLLTCENSSLSSLFLDARKGSAMQIF